MTCIHFLMLYNKPSHTQRVKTTLAYYLTVSKGLEPMHETVEFSAQGLTRLK